MPLSKDKLQEAKRKFLERPRSACALYDSYISSVSRVLFFDPGIDRLDPIRTEFQSRTRNILQDISYCYRSRAMNMTDSEHIEKIIKLRCQLRGEFLDILNNQCLRFGRAQKMLNLYLKHLWVRGYIDAPPHCPFDRNILRELFRPSRESFTPWTQMNDIDEYKRWVNKARQVAKNGQYSSISEWELVTFNEYQAQ